MVNARAQWAAERELRLMATRGVRPDDPEPAGGPQRRNWMRARRAAAALAEAPVEKLLPERLILVRNPDDDLDAIDNGYAKISPVTNPADPFDPAPRDRGGATNGRIGSTTDMTTAEPNASIPHGDDGGDPRSEPGRPTSGSGEQHSGQVRIAHRLANRYADRLLRVHGLGWHYWDGHRWAPDAGNAHARRAVLHILRDALAESMGDKQLRADVGRCESDAGIAGVLGVAASLVEFAFTVADVDADPWLLNCANGTLDLRTRTLRPPDPHDRLTKVTVGAYDPDADPTVWGTFLARVLPDDDERAYLCRVIGQAAHGIVREHLFPILTGTGANGKGTFYGALTNAFGDYATVINPEMLMARDRGGIGGPETMRLLGARLVIGSETQDGGKLDESTMKRLTGGDELTARHLYQEPVSWHPSHQLVYVTNHKPKVKGNDPAVWRRLRVIPFDVVVPEAEWDRLLSERLALHADAVLSWAVAGFFDYEDNGGMREPGTVVRATDDYRASSDTVARFVAEVCEVGPNLHVRSRELFGAWLAWSAADGADPLSEKAFAGELDRLGYAARKTNGSMLRAGLRLPEDGDE